ncbi:hypothetical protein N8Z33_03585 [Flavobacteriaceae bacterium]|nr:hypothetical protein [Flavobacteriaceae bacterium]
MNEDILKDYGWCQVIKRDSKYFIRYDGGGVAVKMIECQVDKEDANKALIDQLQAEKVIIEIQKKQG